jgi:hypothetical protein
MATTNRIPTLRSSPMSRGDGDDEGRQHVQRSVGVVGDDVLFGQHLDGIGDGLDRAITPGTIRPRAVLHAGDDLTLHRREDQYGHDANDHQDQYPHDIGDQVHPPLRHAPAGQEACHPVPKFHPEVEDKIHVLLLTSTPEHAVPNT